MAEPQVVPKFRSGDELDVSKELDVNLEEMQVEREESEEDKRRNRRVLVINSILAIVAPALILSATATVPTLGGAAGAILPSFSSFFATQFGDGFEKFSIPAVPGEIVNYVGVSNVCNNGDGEMVAILSFKGVVNHTQFTQHVRTFYVYWVDGPGVGFVNGTIVATQAPVVIPPNQCRAIGVRVVVDGNVVVNQLLASYRIDIETG